MGSDSSSGQAVVATRVYLDIDIHNLARRCDIYILID